MRTTDRLRLVLLAQLGWGAMGCPPSPKDSEEEACQALPDFGEESGANPALVCTSLTTPCPDGDAAEAAEAVQEILEATSSAGSGYNLDEVTCGPVEADGVCCYGASYSEWVEGRPFLVAGAPRVAPSTPGSWGGAIALAPVPEADRPALAARWLAVARMEHASVAAFARSALHLMALGAPADLLADTAAAMADEVRHARVAFGVAAALGADGAPGPLDVADALGEVDPADVLRTTFREGCVGETVAAALAAEGARLARDPAAAAVLAAIAEDEARHAALAWRTVAWLVSTRPALGAVLAAEQAALPSPEPRGVDLAAYGLLGGERAAALATEVRARVVGPCLAAMPAAV